MTGPVVLVDGNNILRSAMAVKMNGGLTSERGVSTGPLVIFINRLARYVRELAPHRLLVAWDHSGPNRRTALYSGYKAHRVPAPVEELEERESHFNLAKEFCAVAGVGHIALPGCEADDIIAGVWRTVNPTHDVNGILIVSNDSDFGQLIGDNPHGLPTEQVRLTPKSPNLDRLTADRICAEWGVQHPSDLARIKVLTGDTSDNVPGIRGIGPKKAVKLLASNLWSLDEIARVHPEHATLIERNRQLIELRTIELTVRAPLWQPTGHTSAAFESLVAFLRRYELAQVLDRVMAGSLWSSDDANTLRIGKRPRAGSSS